MPRVGSPMERAALAYAAYGWRVFPLRGKAPAIPKAEGGNGVHDATTDPSRVRAWWRRWPQANAGLAAGAPSGWWALDIDPAHGGEESLAALEAEHGPLPETVEQCTGSGGRHILFAYRGEPIRNRAGERHHLPPGVDSRASGGYIVAAPSVHPDTGRAYFWRPDRHPLRHPLAAAPAWLVATVALPGSARPAALLPRRPPPPTSWGPKPAYAQAALDRAARAIAGAQPGSQEATLNGEDLSVGRLIGAGLMPDGFARVVLVRAGAMMVTGDPCRPWRLAEIAAKVNRALDDGRRQPRGVRR